MDRTKRPITLRCPMCKRTKIAPRDNTDPPNTCIVEAPCDKCDCGGMKPETSYYDAQGHQIYYPLDRTKPRRKKDAADV